jgi:hypothetical protein
MQNFDDEGEPVIRRPAVLNKGKQVHPDKELGKVLCEVCGVYITEMGKHLKTQKHRTNEMIHGHRSVSEFGDDDRMPQSVLGGPTEGRSPFSGVIEPPPNPIVLPEQAPRRSRTPEPQRNTGFNADTLIPVGSSSSSSSGDGSRAQRALRGLFDFVGFPSTSV